MIGASGREDQRVNADAFLQLFGGAPFASGEPAQPTSEPANKESTFTAATLRASTIDFNDPSPFLASASP
jgi:hypothetical protein